MNIKKYCINIFIIFGLVACFILTPLLFQNNITEVSAASEISINTTGTVEEGPLNVRSGPGQGYKVVSQLPEGKSITVLSKKVNSKGEAWYKFKYKTSEYGYISSEYVTLKSKTITFKRKALVKVSSINVRSGSSTSYKILGSVKKGAAIYINKKIIKSNGDIWYQFTYNGKVAYITGDNDYLSLTSIVSETTINTGAIVKAGPLNVRSGPGTTYSKIGTLKEDKNFHVLMKIKKTDGSTWYKFKYSSSKNGYVSADYVQLISVKSESSFTRKAGVKSKTLKMRSGPGTSYKWIDTLDKGDVIYINRKYVMTTGATWYRYTYNGKTGYSNGSSTYISLTDIVSEKSISEKASAKCVVNVRTGPSTGYSKFDQLKKGDQITVVKKVLTKKNGTWYRCKLKSGEYGYVYADYIQLGVGVTFKMGTVTTDSGVSLNVRSGPGTGYTRLGSVSSGSVVIVTGSGKDSNGKLWYKYQYESSSSGWLCSDYLSVKTVTSTAAFENYMKEQGFPESYKPGLRALKAAHPNWVFKAYDVGCTWSTAVNKENASPGLNVIDTSLPKSWRSKASDCYNSKTGVWSRFDGRWYSAHLDVIKYYMDPRNFLTEDGIYQFLTHKYDSKTQSAETVRAVVDGTFMETRDPGNGWSSFSTLINAAGKNSGVNPNVLAAMIIQEQGTKGTSGCISGTVSGYKGYYNFLNIGAYTTSTMSAVQRGLWYAKEKGWNTEYKSIKGGADIYHNNYVEKNQYTFYTKKFNVMNGTSKIGTHQYMTNVQGAYGEAVQLKKAFPDNYNKALTFIIPVYDSMPSKPCDLP